MQTLVAPARCAVAPLKTFICWVTPCGPSAQAKWVILPMPPTTPYSCSCCARA
ncbi:Uncharacterised protein [Bordetella pertussis]|nr:Uncharacterised protein [Bordetella pertussis]